jgi:hypothetical protein
LWGIDGKWKMKVSSSVWWQRQHQHNTLVVWNSGCWGSLFYYWPRQRGVSRGSTTNSNYKSITTFLTTERPHLPRWL